ncbi:MAG: type II toxin-antitoxin system VapC family toxin [Thermoanaerobaculia bacterium]
MAALVVDPSAILALAMDDEAADYAALVLSAIEAGGAAVPSIFWYELRNVLVVSERRGRISPERTGAFLAALAHLPIESTVLPSELGVLQIARDHSLTVYDASYLDLALRRNLPLATLDNRLRAAAGAVGVVLLDDH